MKLWVEGKPEQVRPFMLELARHVEVFPSEPIQKVNEDQEVIVCLIRYQPRKRVTVVEIETKDNGLVRIPFLDLVMAEMDQGQSILAGWTYDIFG
jgi:hypothetical protein